MVPNLIVFQKRSYREIRACAVICTPIYKDRNAWPNPASSLTGCVSCFGVAFYSGTGSLTLGFLQSGCNDAPSSQKIIRLFW